MDIVRHGNLNLRSKRIVRVTNVIDDTVETGKFQCVCSYDLNPT